MQCTRSHARNAYQSSNIPHIRISVGTSRIVYRRPERTSPSLRYGQPGASRAGIPCVGNPSRPRPTRHELPSSKANLAFPLDTGPQVHLLGRGQSQVLRSLSYCGRSGSGDLQFRPGNRASCLEFGKCRTLKHSDLGGNALTPELFAMNQS
jgi:hypothetical protein